jgi:plasmid stability protein
MASVTVKNIPDELYERLKALAKVNHRSINGEIIALIERSVGKSPEEVAEILERTRQIRELTAHYIITDDEITRMKNEGRE